MLEALGFLLVLGLTFRLEKRLPLAVLGVWLNLLWFVYQNELGSGWLAYLRGLGAGIFLAAGYGRPGLAWALTPWPLLLYLRLDLQELAFYLPSLGEGMLLGALLYLAGLRKR
ncbi:MAG: hypothetical protein NZ846_04145 [Thermus sp.]|uniref:hypothetical protein n=1 Tax=unclassified Thermus TaxID=2619321 RepID=UPI000238946E|nr:MULTISPECIES: hypothetical protein [unclassified Thermus]AEV16795.1 hypothetical protein TCCBUS3UF1_17560 [Thermus sp. CCB_US3_UF1]MCS6868348.1 hypothetical protein [Thermus sp.]MCS7218152.1 hypothetical protein [Thermus sp.]MCX7850631.1 hypothetical protein [Thermus sp.]MDW8017563.1 hypothetical protein [Thermus sp.]